MKWMGSDYAALMQLPEGYLDIIIEEIKTEREAYERQRREAGR